MDARNSYPDRGESQPLDIRSQGTQIGAEECGQHVDALVDKVYCCSPRGGLGVHRRVGVDKIGHVCNIWETRAADK